MCPCARTRSHTNGVSIASLPAHALLPCLCGASNTLDKPQFWRWLELGPQVAICSIQLWYPCGCTGPQMQLGQAAQAVRAGEKIGRAHILHPPACVACLGRSQCGTAESQCATEQMHMHLHAKIGMSGVGLATRHQPRRKSTAAFPVSCFFAKFAVVGSNSMPGEAARQGVAL